MGFKLNFLIYAIKKYFPSQEIIKKGGLLVYKVKYLIKIVNFWAVFTIDFK